MPNLAWGITGASDKLLDTFAEVEKIAAMDNVRITTFISQAGVELVKHFGLQSRLTAISDGSPWREIVGPRTHGESAYLACRFFAREYEALLVAPCSSNTLCKLSAGICDTPVTNAAMWAAKGNLSVFLLQTHMTMGQCDSPLFVRVKDEACKRCDVCPPVEVCDAEAISRSKDKFPRIRLFKCVRCGDCVPACPFGAVASGERFRLNRRMVDQEAAERVTEIKGMAVLGETRQIEPTLKRYAVEHDGPPL